MTPEPRPRPHERTLEAFLRDELSAAAHAGVERHLPDCRQCDGVLSALTDDRHLRRQLEDVLSTDADDLLIADPPTIPGHRIGRACGHGSQSVVFKAVRTADRSIVAVKVARGISKSARWRFEQEIQILRQIRHRNGAQVLDAGEVSCSGARRAYMVLEFVDGEPITQFARRRRLSLTAKMELLVRVCAALETAHCHGVVHRDLKPANILVTRDGSPKVMDFGIAHGEGCRSRTTSIETVQGQVLGTLGYASPEQAGGNVSSIDLRSDIYSLGVLAYELFAGIPPYDLSRLPAAEAARVIAEEIPRRPSRLVRSIPRKPDRVILAALAKEPDARQASASGFARMLHHSLEQTPWSPRSALRVLKKPLPVPHFRTKVTLSALALAIAAFAGGVVGYEIARRGVGVSWDSYGPMLTSKPE